MDEDLILDYGLNNKPGLTSKQKQVKEEDLEQLNECYALFKQYVKSSQGYILENRVKGITKRPNDYEKNKRKPLISKFINNAIKRYPNRSKNTKKNVSIDEEYPVLDNDLSSICNKRNYFGKTGNKLSDEMINLIEESTFEQNNHSSDNSVEKKTRKNKEPVPYIPIKCPHYNSYIPDPQANPVAPAAASVAVTKRIPSSPNNYVCNLSHNESNNESQIESINGGHYIGGYNSGYNNSYNGRYSTGYNKGYNGGKIEDSTNTSSYNNINISKDFLTSNNIMVPYKGPEPTPPFCHTRLYDANGPVSFTDQPRFNAAQHQRAELRAWYNLDEVIISQNSSKRRVLRGIWLSPITPTVSYPVAIKSVEDQNTRDGRSVKREIECHLYIYSKLSQLQNEDKYNTITDSWPSSELLGYYMDKDNPGKCILITRKLSGPDFFDVIRQENINMTNLGVTYEYHKINWCIIALKRIIQYGKLGIRHNDIKPDNIVLDFYENSLHEKLLDVKIIDLGTASMHTAKEFTGGTSWYESPEQKILEYYSKKIRDVEKAKNVDINLSSDIWAAGLSITEVLLGKRVVDHLKPPNGPGPLDFRGPELGWAVEPNIWVSLARKALLNKYNNNHYSYEAAKYIFDNLVRPNPSERANLSDAINQLYFQIRKILKKIRKSNENTLY